MKSSMIYFVQRADGLIKIGITIDLQRRLKQIAKGHGPLAVLRSDRGGRNEESLLHSALSSFNQFGEWFAPAKAVLDAALSYQPPSIKLDDANENGGAADDDSREREAILAAERNIRSALRALCLRGARAPVKRMLERLGRDHSISPNSMERILKGRSRTLTAGLAAALKAMALLEMQKSILSLQNELAGEAA